MDFLVEFDVDVPDGTPETEVADRQTAEASAAAKLAEDGHLLRVWQALVAPAESRVLSLYRAESETELNSLLQALPLYDWMRIKVTPLAPHPNDPAPVAR
jgi:muconolactone D-isomerase